MAPHKKLTDNEARTIIEGMRDTAIQDCVNLARRVEELKAEQESDPTGLTAAQITRLQARYDKRVEEAKALAEAAVKFPRTDREKLNETIDREFPKGVIDRFYSETSDHAMVFDNEGTVWQIFPDGEIKFYK